MTSAQDTLALVVSCVLIAVSSGCQGTSTDASTKKGTTGESDQAGQRDEEILVATWTAFVDSVAANGKSNAEDPEECVRKHFEVRGDLKKTDSLLNPYLGVLEIRTSRHTHTDGPIPYVNNIYDCYFIECEFRDGGWVPGGGTQLTGNSYDESKMRKSSLTAESAKHKLRFVQGLIK